MTICWDCRQRDGSHLAACSRINRMVSDACGCQHWITQYRKSQVKWCNRHAQEREHEEAFSRRWGVLSDDDVAWCREQLAARWTR